MDDTISRTKVMELMDDINATLKVILEQPDMRDARLMAVGSTMTLEALKDQIKDL